MYPHATAGYRTWRRHLMGVMTGAMYPSKEALRADLEQSGFTAGQKDALSKQPQNWETAWTARWGAMVESPDWPAAGPEEQAAVKEVFRKAYLSGYGDIMVELDKVSPGASAQLTLLNLAEGTKINRDTDPEAFNRWVQEQAKKPGFDATMALGLAALTGVAVTGPGAGTKTGADTPTPSFSPTMKVAAGVAGAMVAGVVAWEVYDLRKERRMEDAHRANQQRLWREFIAADEREERMRRRG